MKPASLRVSGGSTLVGQEMHRLISELYPICRSITGDGVRDTLRIIARLIPLTIHEVPSGTAVFDWTVPKEWTIRDAYVRNIQGERVIDFQKSNLHIVSYSIPVRLRLSLNELKEHLFTLPEHPDWIPYRTSYYRETWGFCLAHNRLAMLPEGEYEVSIDSSLEEGSLTYGELLVEGQTSDEVLISTHACHPSLCNDNLSGVAVAAFLAKSLAQRPHRPRYSYRFLFIPGTIGAITWLSRHAHEVARIKHGLVASCLGDAGRFTYKRSRRGDAEIDRAVGHVLRHSGRDHDIVDFFPYGYDERQYCSPGFNLPVGCLSRTPPGRFPQYHTSADDLEFVRPERLAESLALYSSVVGVLEHNKTYLNTNPHGEPQLGRRGLYPTIGGATSPGPGQHAMLWVLNLSDGAHSLLDIAERSGLAFDLVQSAAGALVQHGLLTECVG
jgi:aminopeptidase-like protein